MLKSTQKISSQEFKQFYKKGKKIRTNNFNISLIFNKKKGNPKFAVIISKKIVKTAVLRNKNKRKVYKILRQIYPQFLEVKYGFIFLKKNILSINEQDLEKELRENIK